MIWRRDAGAKEQLVDGAELNRRLLARYGIRVEPYMSAYLLDQLDRAGTAMRKLPVMGGDARTGMPVQANVDPQLLLRPDVSA